MSLEDVRAESPVERLLEESWNARRDGVGRRELLVELLAGLVFLAIAVPMALEALAHNPVDPLLAVGLLCLYAVSSRVIRFALGAGYVVPSYLVLVPMLLLLPPGLAPLLACGGLVLGTSLQWLSGNSTLERVPMSVPDAWHTLGPAAVLLAAGHRTGVALAAVYIAAFCAGCLVDLVSATLREAAIAGVAPPLQLRVLAFVWLIDACLAPVGLLLAHAARPHHAEILLILPLNAAMLLASRDRDARIAQAQLRLDAVARERTRLQTAVRRLGEALAARLDLAELTGIVLRSSVEALDADGGKLILEGIEMPLETEVGCASDSTPGLRSAVELAETRGTAVQLERDGRWTLALPFSFAGRGGRIEGAIAVTRPGRAFRSDEQSVMEELADRARRAAGDIVAHQVLREQAHTDTLTGLGNRRKLAADIQQWERESEPLVLMLFDLDGFKGYNDTFGHMAGDAMLARLGARLASAVAGRGSAYRLGGDEFCATLFANLPDLEAAIATTGGALAERGENFAVGASWGAVLLPHETDNIDYALQLADERMYARKRDRPGRGADHTRELLREIMSARQPVLGDCSSEVAALSRRVGQRLGLAGEELDELVRAAELQDIGNVGIPDAILDKPGPLSEAEQQYMHQQPVLGERILSAAPALRPVAALVRSSRERWDGRGYPDGLKAEQIPLGSRILATCTAYRSMVGEHFHSPARTHAEACAELRVAAGSQFDPSVVEALLAELEDPADGAGSAEALTPASEFAERLGELLADGPEPPAQQPRPRSWPGDR